MDRITCGMAELEFHDYLVSGRVINLIDCYSFWAGSSLSQVGFKKCDFVLCHDYGVPHMPNFFQTLPRYVKSLKSLVL